MAASEDEKKRIWRGLDGKNASSFKYIGVDADFDEYTNGRAWKNTISALNTIGKCEHSIIFGPHVQIKFNFTFYFSHRSCW